MSKRDWFGLAIRPLGVWNFTQGLKPALSNSKMTSHNINYTKSRNSQTPMPQR